MGAIVIVVEGSQTELEQSGADSCSAGGDHTIS